MTARWNRLRPTRATVPYRQQECRLLESSADHYWNAVRLPKSRWHHIKMAKDYLDDARKARAQVGPVLP